MDERNKIFEGFSARPISQRGIECDDFASSLQKLFHL
jgi:hypothetical protein